jgi:hypothetical protein
MVDTPHEAEQPQVQDDPELRNEGEGSRTAARRYQSHVEAAAKDEKHVEELAEEAEKALEGPEGDELREAEERGKRHEHK